MMANAEKPNFLRFRISVFLTYQENFLGRMKRHNGVIIPFSTKKEGGGRVFPLLRCSYSGIKKAIF